MSQTKKILLERFGRYLILDHLVDGGMAKICRARFLGEQADKVVAIKMIQPQFSNDEAFKAMFMDEIKLTFGLIHPNIMQVYDYGIQNNQLYVAMEYCDGKNLKEYLEKLRERKYVFPVSVTVYIISQVCQGLHYAHTFTDKLTGKETKIIHRDISPHNIMLTYDGSVKIIDFGIAKSKVSSESTQAGTIKGKLSYLAPEYLEGGNIELDHRYDQFAVGITLWEMLCGRKLFRDNNDLAVLRKIQECKVEAPSKINPNVPKELDDIVLKALSKDREKRFENMEQMNKALIKFLYSNYSDFSNGDLSYFSQELFKDEIKADRERMFEFGKIDIRPFIEDWKREGVAPVPRSEDKQGKSNIIDFGFEDKESTKPTLNRGKLTKASPKTKDEPKEELKLQRSGEGDKFERTRTMTSTSTRMNGMKKNQGQTVNDRKMEETISPVGKADSPLRKVASIAAILMVLGAGYYSFIAKKTTLGNNHATAGNKENGKENRAVASTSEQEEFSYGFVQLEGYNNKKHKVFIDDQKVDVDFMGTFKVPIRKDLKMRIEKEGSEHFIHKFRVENDESALVIKVPEFKPAAFGYLVNSRKCVYGELHFEIFGEERNVKLPIEDSVGIAFPLTVDERGVVSLRKHKITLKRSDTDIDQVFEFTLNHEDESVDLCQVVLNPIN